MFAKHAQYYLDQGLSVIPAMSDKRPAIPTWAPYQTRMPSAKEVEAWSRNLGDMNIAVICGRLSNLTVVDCDTPGAIQEVESLLPEGAEIPIVTTPRGGRHYYFRYCPELHSRNGAGEGIDVKSDGGYVLAPPSKTENGVYVWNSEMNLDTIPERPPVPDALQALLIAGTNPVLPSPDKPILTQGTRDQGLFHTALQLFNDGRPRDQVEWIIVNMAKVCTPPFPEQEARAKVESAWKRHQRKGRDDENGGVSLAERISSSIAVRSIPWLAQDLLPTYMAINITGDAGEGKTLVAVDWTARVSRGMAFPAYGKAGPAIRGHVFYVTSEGVPEMILVPRLIAAGADLEKVTIIEGVTQRNGEFSMLDITQHLPMLERRAKDFPDLKMIVIDPIASFLPAAINPSQQNAVRQAMDKISNLAYKLGVAAPTIMHFNKTSGARAIHRTSGSVQFEASVKMSWSVVRRENDSRNARLIVPQKSNITGSHKSLEFTIHSVEFPAPDNPKEIIRTAKIEYGALIDEDPETLISPQVDGPENHVNSATKFLRRKLDSGTTLYAVTLIDEAEEAGIPKWALYKAKDKMGIQHDKEGTFQGRTFWFIPTGKA